MVTHFKGMDYADNDDPVMHGWYICMSDDDGKTYYDCIGPYDTEDEARKVYAETLGKDENNGNQADL